MNTVRRFSQMINEAGIMITDKTADSQSFSNILQGYKDVKEIGGDNRGKQVEAILKRVGLGPGASWCNAFVYTVFDDFCKQKGIKPTPLPPTGLVMAHWDKANPNVSKKITKQEALADPTLVRPGQVWFKTRKCDSPGGRCGHAGVVIGVDTVSKTFVAMDGNSGDKVSIRRYSLSMPELLGFIDYIDDLEFSVELGKQLSQLSGITSVGTETPAEIVSSNIESGPGKEN